MNKIIYLDAAASCLKPESVVEAELGFLRNNYSNAGRGICARAAAADAMVMNARAAAAGFINADPGQVVFTSGTTDGMNRIVNMVMPTLKSRAIVAASDLDHHSARMPWENRARRGECEFVLLNLDTGLNIDASRMPRADVMVITAMSNVLGAAQDVAAIIRAARAKNPNVITIVDAAQYVAHCKIDVRVWDCDFLCFSAHKIGADTGLGIMYIKNPDDFYPDKFGGGMVKKISGAEWLLEDAPAKFEAGTLPLTQIAGLPAAIEAWRAWPGGAEMIRCLYDELSKIPRIKILTGRDAALMTFVVDGMHVLDFGTMAGAHNICLRVGNMCASWIHNLLGIRGSIRISVGPWNTMAEIKETIDIIKGIVK